MNTQKLPPGDSLWHSLVEAKIGRRSLFKGLAVAGAAAVAGTAPLQLQRATSGVDSMSK